MRISSLAIPLGITLGLVAVTGALLTAFPDVTSRSSTPTATAQTVADQANPHADLSFNRDIRPILSDKCFACHGPDAEVAKGAGGFRLDIREGAVVPAEASGKVPIVPGDAEGSEVIKRIESARPHLVMPPPEAHLKVTDDELALLKQWIDEGAAYEGHWAYETPARALPPKVSEANQAWVKNDIDRFIAARLEQAGLAPSPEADKATLIRRVSLDLIGLPPTPDEIDAFVADESPNAYETLVDRLLASPHFGERLALIWLDAARYADTIGYQLDHYRASWPYRDYVIQSFNDNKPYDRFLIEQLAGDLLPGATDEQILATAFCRMHMMNHEGGSIDEEFRVTAVADRIETIATVFMAQTYNCAMCHDHKYDPTTQQDYFNLFKYFHSINERGIWTNRPERAIAYGDRIQWYTPAQREQLAEAQAALDDILRRESEAVPDLQQQQKQWEQALRDRHGVRWIDAELKDAQSTQFDASFQFKPDGSVLLTNRDVPHNENLTLTYKTNATAIRLIKLDALTDRNNNGWIDRGYNGRVQPTHIEITATSLADPSRQKQVKLKWAWATQSNRDRNKRLLGPSNLFKPGKPGWSTGSKDDPSAQTLLLVADEPFGFEGGSELRVRIEHQAGGRRTMGRVRLGFAQADASVTDVMPVVTNDWYQLGPFKEDSFDAAFDKAYGPESGDNPIDPKGKHKWEHQPDYTPGKDHRLVFRRAAYYLGQTISTPDRRTVKLQLGYANGVRVFLNGEEVYTFAASGNETEQDKHAIKLDLNLRAGDNRLVVKFVNTRHEPTDFNWSISDRSDTHMTLGLIPEARRTSDGQETFTQLYRKDRSSFSGLLAAAKQALKDVQDSATPVSVMKELDEPKPMFLLSRGAYNKPIKDKPAKLDLPSFIDLPLPAGAPNNRLGFARWLVQPEHPLTARVHVNRLWQMLFGRGIVSTAEDFGSQAAWPSHPELLDTLAVDFVESGWDQKALLKQIVMSATYRQRAKHNKAAAEIDADNSLLSYFPRRRLPGELIRDHALAASGLLNSELGGPSVKPYQPPGLWREVSMGPRSNTNVFRRDTGEKLYRRSLYTFIKRKSPPPQLQTFGTPNRESCVVNRGVTTTPLQTLVLWNDEQFLEAARALAQLVLTQAETDDARLILIVRRCTGKRPTAEAIAVLRDALTHYRERYAEAPAEAEALLTQGEHPLPDVYDAAELASWTMVAHIVLSIDETIVRD
jgi:hypothetical protein